MSRSDSLEHFFLIQCYTLPNSKTPSFQHVEKSSLTYIGRGENSEYWCRITLITNCSFKFNHWNHTAKDREKSCWYRNNHCRIIDNRINC